MEKHKLDNLFKEMYRKAGLATIYTALCIRATSVTVLKAAGLENNRARSVTGHSRDKSIESYNARPTTEQQFESSANVSRFITKQNQSNSVLPAVPPPSESFLTSIQQQNQLHSRSMFNVADFSHSTFHGCNFVFSPSKDTSQY